MENLEKPELTPEEKENKKAIVKKIIFITIMIDILIAYFVFYFFVYNKKEAPVETQTGSVQNYTIAETLDVSCNIDSDCETPGDYLIRSSCPYTSKCLEKKCSVICPTIR